MSDNLPLLGLALLVPFALPAVLGAAGIAVGSAGAGAAAAAGSAGAVANIPVAAGFLGTGLTGVEFLSLSMSTAAGLSTIAAGQQKAAGLELQAESAKINATQASLEGRRAAIEAMAEASDLAAASAVHLGTRGINRDFGTPTLTTILDAERAESDIGLVRLSGLAGVAAHKTQAVAFKAQAKSARKMGMIGGLTNFAGGASALLER